MLKFKKDHSGPWAMLDTTQLTYEGWNVEVLTIEMEGGWWSMIRSNSSIMEKFIRRCGCVFLIWKLSINSRNLRFWERKGERVKGW